MTQQKKGWLQDNIFNLLTALVILAGAMYNVMSTKARNEEYFSKVDDLSKKVERLVRSYPLHQQRNYNDLKQLRDFIWRKWGYDIDLQTLPPYQRRGE